VLSTLLAHVDVKAAAVAGLAAGAVYIATQEIDNRLTGQRNDDLKLLGRLLVKGPEHAKLVGLLPHTINSVNLGIAYAALAHDRLPGPPWLRGAIFANVENTILYPIALLEDKHPGIRNGEIDRYLTLKAYFQSVPRHITYGAVVGPLYERLRRS
jgi:hypothetical protein